MNVFIDGSSLGNPGEAGIGIIFADGEHPVKNISKAIGKQTNNFAEYFALITALAEARQMKLKKLHIFSDSQLLCRQINGIYKVKNAGLIGLFSQARKLLTCFEICTITHIPREKNTGADRLAKSAASSKQKSKIGEATAP